MSEVVWPALHPVVTEEAGTRGGTHAGIDLEAERGDPVLAAFDGVVIYVGGDGATGRLWVDGRWLYPSGQGRTVDILRPDGLISRVGHLESYNVAQGDTVQAGHTIAYAGDSGYSTGVHIHWETRWDRAWVGGAWVDPRSLNPQVFEGDFMSQEQYDKVMHELGEIRKEQTKNRALLTTVSDAVKWIKDAIGGTNKKTSVRSQIGQKDRG